MAAVYSLEKLFIYLNVQIFNFIHIFIRFCTLFSFSKNHCRLMSWVPVFEVWEKDAVTTVTKFNGLSYGVISETWNL